MTALFNDSNGRTAQIINPNFDSNRIQNVTVSGTSAPTTNAVPDGCRLVMLVSTTNCWFRPGASPTAAKDNTSIYLPAGVYFYLPVTGRAKVAFIQDSAGGTAQVIPAR